MSDLVAGRRLAQALGIEEYRGSLRFMLSAKSKTLTRPDLMEVMELGARPPSNSSLKNVNVKFGVIISGFLVLRNLTNFLKESYTGGG